MAVAWQKGGILPNVMEIIMITIRFNEALYQLERGRSLKDILSHEGYESPYFAVAINKQFVPRTDYVTTFLQEGDCVEVVSPMQGG